MPEGPLVSIITPTYNHERFIAECIESVLSQTYPHWEQIVVDDGSSDRTADVVSRYDDERIILLRQPNRGIWHLAETYNSALSRCSGEFVAILEGDDLWPPYKLQLQMKEFAASEAVLSWGQARIIDSRGGLMGVYPDRIEQFRDLSAEQMLAELLFENPIPSCTVVCRRGALLAAGGFRQPPGLPYVDMPTWLELALGGEFLPIDEALGCYRRHGRQITAAMKSSMIRASRYSLDFFDSLPADLRDSLGRSVPGLRSRLDRKAREYYYYAGRADLMEGNRSEARRNFLQALRHGHPALKAKAMLGLLFSLLGLDMDLLDALSRRKKYDDRG